MFHVSAWIWTVRKIDGHNLSMINKTKHLYWKPSPENKFLCIRKEYEKTLHRCSIFVGVKVKNSGIILMGNIEVKPAATTFFHESWPYDTWMSSQLIVVFVALHIDRNCCFDWRQDFASVSQRVNHYFFQTVICVRVFYLRYFLYIDGLFF